MLELNLEFARVFVALLGTTFAAYEDWKTSFINDRLMLAMIAGGLLFDVASGDWNLIVYAVGGAALIFAIGWLLYRAGQLGGGDVLLFVGLHLLLPAIPLQTVNAVQAAVGLQQYALVGEMAAIIGLPFFLSVLLAASVFAMIGTTAFYARLLFKKGFSPKPDFLLAAPFLLFTIGFLAIAVTTLAFSAVQMAFFAILFGCGIFLAAFKKQIEDELVIREITIKEIEDEDVLALDKMKPGLVKKYGLEKVLTKEQVQRLKKLQKELGIKKFPVFKLLPRFGPYVLWGLLACLAVGDVLVASFAG
ncbi:MAG: A24 family peptidase [Candidatus Micrarchaeia archaeon]|jgi:hypothetical protein